MDELTWEGTWFTVSLFGGQAPFYFCRGFQVHLSFPNDFLWSCRLGHCSFSAPLLFRFVFCSEALWCQVAQEEDVLSLSSFQVAAEFVALEFLAFSQEGSARYTEQRVEHNVCACARRVSDFVLKVLRVSLVFKSGALTSLPEV